MTRCIIGIVLLVLSVGTAASGKSAAIKNCKLRWPGNNTMITLCMEREMDTRKALRKLSRKGHGSLISACEKANPGAAKGTDWTSTMACTRHHLKQQKRR